MLPGEFPTEDLRNFSAVTVGEGSLTLCDVRAIARGTAAVRFSFQPGFREQVGCLRALSPPVGADRPLDRELEHFAPAAALPRCWSDWALGLGPRSEV